jgi:PHIKZ182|nr:MAG TPA: hypothetical protein [Caudoviricetes sp.]
MAFDERGYILRNYVRVDQAKSISEDVNTIDTFIQTNREKVLDLDWVRTRFNITNKELSTERLINGRFFSTASFKYSNTRLGGHLACNPKPQWTRYADIRPRYNPTLSPDRPFMSTQPTGSDSEMSLGRYYSEAIDDNVNLVFLTFGTKKFNGLIDFFMSAIDYGDVIVANTGRKPTLYNIGSAIGGFAVFACFPWTTAIVWATKALVGFLNMDNAFDYYYMRPTMHTYWSTVSNLTTQLATELKLIAPIIENRSINNIQQEVHDAGFYAQLDKDELQMIADMLGGQIFNSKTGYLDIFAIMSGPQAAYRDFLRRKQKQLSEQEGSTGVPIANDYGAMLAIPDGSENIYDDVRESANALQSSGIATFQDYLDKAIKERPEWDSPKNPFVQSGEKSDNDIDAQIANAQNTAFGSTEDIKRRSSTTEGFVHNFNLRNGKNTEERSWIDQFVDTTSSVIHDGGLSAIFQVDYVGTLTESFSNDVRDIETGGLLKSVASGAQDMKFNFSGGNVGGPVDTGAIMSGVKELLMGGANGISMGLSNVLATVFGDAYVDIPKRWGDSSASFPTVTYNTKLACVYGNDFSRMQSIGIPLCMLIAGALPLSTGKSSYTSPFLCSVTSQGVQNIKLGMITSLSITRGTTNLPFTKTRKPLGVDVSFTVTDFSTLVTAPITKGVFSDLFKFGMDDASPMGRYLATLAGRDIQTDKYALNKLGMRLARARANLYSVVSPSRVGSAIGSVLNGPLSLFTAQGNLTTSLPGASVRAQ